MTDLSHKPTLVGERVLLRPMVAGDVDAMVEILSDPQVRLLTGSVTSSAEARQPQERDARLLDWYATRGAQPDRLDLAVVDPARHEVVGEIVLNAWNPVMRTANLRILLGPAGRGRGLGTEAVRLLTAYALDVLHLNEVTLGVYAMNPRAQHVYEKVGFTVTGREEGELALDGDPVDLVLMSVSAETLRRPR